MSANGDALRAIAEQVDADTTAAAAAIAARDAQIADLQRRLDDTTRPEPRPEPAPKPNQPGLIFGINCNGASGSTDEERVLQHGRLPMSRQYALEIPVGQWGPEKRAQLSAKPNLADFNAGRLDSWYVNTIAGHLDDGAALLLATIWHEPNGELNKGQLTIGDLHAAWKRQARLHADNFDARVVVAPNFTAPQRRTGVAWRDEWMLRPDDLPGGMWTWDNYSNPAGAKNYGGDVYATPYPGPGEVADEMIDVTGRFGWLDAVGITEWNSPRRSTKNPPDMEEWERIACLQAYVDYVRAALPKLRHMLLWEALKGVQFDQQFKRQRTHAWWAGLVATSA